MVAVNSVTTEKEVEIVREFDVPREEVFAAWTEPAALAAWFAPNGCEISYKSIDVREGGRYHSCVRTPEGYECWCIGEYREILPPDRLVFTMAIADPQGNPATALERGMDPDWPLETTVTVTFEAIWDRTRITLRQTVAENLAKRTGAYPSWLQMLDRLAERVS